MLLFFLPIIISFVVIMFMWLLIPEDLFPIIGVLLLFYFISPFGKEVLVPTAILALLNYHGDTSMFLDVLLVSGTVIFVDVMCSLFLLWNLELLKLLPRVGGWIERVEDAGRRRLTRSRNRRRNIFIGLTSYVALPFQGSGGVVSTIFGMISGMGKHRIWTAVWVGSAVGSTAVALLSFQMGNYLLDVFGSFAWYLLSLVFIIVLALYVLLNYYKNRGRDAEV
jgi:uncharacterized membrane protein